MQPAGFADFGEICYNAGPGFLGMGASAWRAALPIPYIPPLL